MTNVCVCGARLDDGRHIVSAADRAHMTADAAMARVSSTRATTDHNSRKALAPESSDNVSADAKREPPM